MDSGRPSPCPLWWVLRPGSLSDWESHHSRLRSASWADLRRGERKERWGKETGRRNRGYGISRKKNEIWGKDERKTGKNLRNERKKRKNTYYYPVNAMIPQNWWSLPFLKKLPTPWLPRPSSPILEPSRLVSLRGSSAEAGVRSLVLVSVPASSEGRSKGGMLSSPV